MTSIEQRAGALDPYFNRVQQARDTVRKDGTLLTRYDEETLRMNVSTMEQLVEIDERSDMPDRDKFMARLALRDAVQANTDIDTQRRIMRDGMAILDRVYGEFNDDSLAVMRVEKEGVVLYPSRGTDNLQIVDERQSSSSLGGRERWLTVEYENGIRVSANPMLDDMIQLQTESDAEKIIGVLNGKGGVHGNDPFHRLRKWDPEHPLYHPTFVRLGKPTDPHDVSSLIVTDSQRFALRTASELTGNSDWLKAERPSEEFRAKLIKEFAYAYWDLLAFGEPVDGQTQQIMHMSSKGKIGIEHRRNRKRSLVDYTTVELAAIHYGAEVTMDQMIDATQEIIDRKEHKADTMRKEYRVVRAKRDFRAFFYGVDED